MSLFHFYIHTYNKCSLEVNADDEISEFMLKIKNELKFI